MLIEKLREKSEEKVCINGSGIFLSKFKLNEIPAIIVYGKTRRIYATTVTIIAFVRFLSPCLVPALSEETPNIPWFLLNSQITNTVKRNVTISGI